MNDRMTELYAKACLDARDIHPDDVPAFIACMAEKFAELIVRECVKFCEHESNDDEHDEYDMGMWVKAESIKTAIKQHFGVEE